LSSKLKTIAEKFNTAILAIHHVVKKVPEDWISGLYGTHGAAAAADSVLYLKGDRGSKAARLYGTGRNIEDFSIGLNFNPEFCVWEPDSSTQYLSLSPERREIFDFLVSAQSPIKLSDIAQGVNKSKTTVQNLLKKLLSLHLVEKTKHGVYQVVDPKKNNRGNVKQSKAVDLMEMMENANSIDLVELMDSMDFRYPAT
jgi:predicted transcriptional regulator